MSLSGITVALLGPLSHPPQSFTPVGHKSFSPTQCQHSPCAEGMCACTHTHTHMHTHVYTCMHAHTHRVQMCVLICTPASPRTQALFPESLCPPPRAPAPHHHDSPGPRSQGSRLPWLKPGTWSPSLCGPDASLPPIPHTLPPPLSQVLIAPRGAVLTSQTCSEPGPSPEPSSL